MSSHEYSITWFALIHPCKDDLQNDLESCTYYSCQIYKQRRTGTATSLAMCLATYKSPQNKSQSSSFLFLSGGTSPKEGKMSKHVLHSQYQQIGMISCNVITVTRPSIATMPSPHSFKFSRLKILRICDFCNVISYGLAICCLRVR